MQTSLWTTSIPTGWVPGSDPPRSGAAALREALHQIARPLILVENGGQMAVAGGGRLVSAGEDGAWPVRAVVPALTPERLGDPDFREQHGVRYACAAGAMANGIASEDLVEAMARQGLLAFFGAAGLPVSRVEAAIHRLQRALGKPPVREDGEVQGEFPNRRAEGRDSPPVREDGEVQGEFPNRRAGNRDSPPFGFNLIHSPNEPGLEEAVASLYLRHGVRRVCASAYLSLTLPVVRYRFSGIHRDARTGAIRTPHHVLAKVSRTEVAARFFSPPPAAMLRALVEEGTLTAEQAEMAALLPVAEDITAEADSGGHTDNRPALTLLPTMLALRDEMQARYEYPRGLRVGAAGGIGTPASACAAFAMGAAYCMTGSINQACVEAGTSDAVREMLARTSQADVTMAPAADMFEMGVKLQVLKWGTMFPIKARKLYDLYRACDSLEQLPAAERATLERDYFRRTVEEEWSATRAFFAERDPRQIERAEREPKHKMALVFRSYLGQSSAWANQGDPTRKVDYQIWCGPAMGAFNEWVKGSFLEPLAERRVAVLAQNLMFGAAYLTRVHWLRAQGVRIPPAVGRFEPLRPDEMARLQEVP